MATTVAGEASGSTIPASSGGPTPVIKIFNKQSRRNPSWMYWSKDCYESEVQPYADHVLYLTTLQPGDSKWDPVTLRNKLTEVIYEEQSGEIRGIVEEFKRLSEIRLEDLIGGVDSDESEEEDSAEKAPGSKATGEGAETGETVDEAARREEGAGQIEMARTTVDPASLSKEELKERTLELIAKAKRLGKPGQRMTGMRRNLKHIPLTDVDRFRSCSCEGLTTAHERTTQAGAREGAA